MSTPIPNGNYSEYLNDILNTYENKKRKNALSLKLSDPTPGNIRRECIDVYKQRYDSTEDQVLTEFFAPDKDGKLTLRSVNNVKADIFKQIPKIIKRRVPNPGLRYIELLAWLIDFKPRPSSAYYIVNSYVPETTIKPAGHTPDQGKSAGGNDKPDHTFTTTSQPSETSNPDGRSGEKTPPQPPFSWKKLLYITLLTITLSGIALIPLLTKKEQPNGFIINTSLKQSCMYWSIDHYEPIDCHETRKDIPVIPYNNQIRINLKKIMLPDTLTKFSLGKVWYSKINGKHEFFTDSGMHPIDTVKRLRPLTTTILQKYTSNDRHALQRVTQTIYLILLAILATLIIITGVFLRKKLKKPY